MQDELAVQEFETGKVHSFDSALDTVSWEEIREEIAPQGTHYVAEDLINQKFVLVSMKRFPSRFPEQEYAYFCIGKTSKGKELFNVVLGGGQPIQVLDAIYDAGLVSPIEFTLSKHEGGLYDGYYTLD